MNKSQIFFWLLVSWIFGVGTRSFFEVPDGFILFGLVISISILSVFWKEKHAVVAVFLFLLFIFGISFLDSRIESFSDYQFSEKQINQTAEVAKEPEKKESYQKLIVRLEDEKEKILINTALYPEYEYGEKIRVKCDLKIPENRDEKFDYRMYLAVGKIKYICEKAQIEKISTNNRNDLYLYILKIKNVLEKNISTSIPQPEASLANGVLFGGSGSMSNEIKNNFSKTGMTHIVAVSGYNVTIIAEYLVLIGIFFGLWRKQALWFAIIGIFIFVAMIGFPSSAVRAGVMGSILIWALKSGRLSNSQNAIIFAGAAMLFLNPMLFRYDAGFQLSFLATLGIVQLSPFLEKINIKRNASFGLFEIIFLTISAQLFVLPVIIYNFESLSIISLLANVLILPIVPISMLLSFLSSIFGILVSPTFNVFAWLAYLPLKYEISIINYLASFSWASVKIENMKEVYIVVYYASLAVAIVYIKNKSKKAR